MVTLGCAVGLIFLPVLLSLVGPVVCFRGDSDDNISSEPFVNSLEASSAEFDQVIPVGIHGEDRDVDVDSKQRYEAGHGHCLHLLTKDNNAPGWQAKLTNGNKYDDEISI